MSLWRQELMKRLYAYGSSGGALVLNEWCILTGKISAFIYRWSIYGQNCGSYPLL